MAWGTIAVGDNGFVGELRAVALTTIRNRVVKRVQDISGYSTIEFIFTKPSAALVEKTAGFLTDGKDGRAVYSPDEDLFDEEGDWQVRLRVGDGSTQITGEPHEFTVVA